MKKDGFPNKGTVFSGMTLRIVINQSLRRPHIRPFRG